jgi:hypothetical protein
MRHWMNRAVTVAEMATFFEMPAHRLERVLLRHGITPAFRAGRVRCYGPAEVRRINAVLNS